MARWTSDRRVYVSADGRVVDESDPTAARLLVGEGGELDEDDARRYGLLGAPETKAREQAPQTKAVEQAPENKSRRK